MYFSFFQLNAQNEDIFGGLQKVFFGGGGNLIFLIFWG